MGRSDSSTTGSDECCPVGLKDEWVQEDGKTEQQNICQSDMCCDGLKEIFNRKPNGVFYSMCVPPLDSHQEINKNVLGKLKELLRK